MPEKPKKPLSPIIKYGLIAMVAAPIGLALLNPPSTSQAKLNNAQEDVGIAEAVCQMTIEKNAKDPESIRWIRDQRQFNYSNNSKTKALSKQPMRAKNSYGALTLSQPICLLTKVNEHWQVTKLSE